MNSSSSEMKLRSPVRSQGRSGETEQDALQRLGVVKNDVTSACVEHYREEQFIRMDA